MGMKRYMLLSALFFVVVWIWSHFEQRDVGESPSTPTPLPGHGSKWKQSGFPVSKWSLGWHFVSAGWVPQLADGGVTNQNETRKKGDGSPRIIQFCRCAFHLPLNEASSVNSGRNYLQRLFQYWTCQHRLVGWFIIITFLFYTFKIDHFLSLIKSSGLIFFPPLIGKHSPPHFLVFHLTLLITWAGNALVLVTVHLKHAGAGEGTYALLHNSHNSELQNNEPLTYTYPTWVGRYFQFVAEELIWALCYGNSKIQLLQPEKHLLIILICAKSWGSFSPPPQRLKQGQIK